MYNLVVDGVPTSSDVSCLPQKWGTKQSLDTTTSLRPISFKIINRLLLITTEQPIHQQCNGLAPVLYPLMIQLVRASTDTLKLTHRQV